MKHFAQPQDVFPFLAERQAKFVEHLRSKGIDLPAARVPTVYRLSDAVLALDAPSSNDVKLDPKTYSITLPITTNATDRYGDIVMPKGCIPHLKNYEHNPQVFFSHKSTDFPVGQSLTPTKALALRFLEDQIIGTCYFHEETEEARAVGRLCMLGILKAASIGFKPVKASILDTKTLHKNRPDETTEGEELVYFDGFCALKFHEWDMLEWSIVPVPANQECIAAALSRGKIDDIPVTDGIRKMLTPYAAQKKITAVIGGFEVPPPPPPVVEVMNADPGDETKDIAVSTETAVVDTTAVKECVVETTSDSELLKCLHECVTWLKDNLLALSEQNQVSHSAILAAIDALKTTKAITPAVVTVAPVVHAVAAATSVTPPPAEDYSKVLALLADMTTKQKDLQLKFFELTGREV